MLDKIIAKNIDNTVYITHTETQFQLLSKLLKKQNKILLKDICSHYNWNYEELYIEVLSKEKY